MLLEPDGCREVNKHVSTRSDLTVSPASTTNQEGPGAGDPQKAKETHAESQCSGIGKHWTVGSCQVWPRRDGEAFVGSSRLGGGRV